MNDFFQLYCTEKYEQALNKIDFEIKENENSQHPKSFQFLWFNRGCCLFKLEKYDLAISQFMEIIENEYSNSKDSYFMIGILFYYFLWKIQTNMNKWNKQTNKWNKQTWIIEWNSAMSF